VKCLRKREIREKVRGMMSNMLEKGNRGVKVSSVEMENVKKLGLVLEVELSVRQGSHNII
jgi:hypothetical protein